MNVLSLFSGAGGLDLGLQNAGHTIIGHCEIDPWAQAVLARHWPCVPIHDDITTYEPERNGTIDLVVGGFPCQNLSLAGNRHGLAGTKSRLWWEHLRIIDTIRPAWALVENVPGLLSSDGGRDMATVVGGLVDIGYGVAWRVLDGQHFGVPQRRRRVFIAACRTGGDPRHAARRAGQMLALAGSGGRHPGPCHKAGQAPSGTLGGGTPGGGPKLDLDPTGGLVTFGPDGLQISHSLTQPQRHQSPDQQTYLAVNVAGGADPSIGTPRLDDHAPVLTSVPLASCVMSFSQNQRHDLRESDLAPSPTAGRGKPGQGMAIARIRTRIRRFTDAERDRLMGWPTDWTRWTANGDEIPTSHRQRLTGNGVIAPVAEWIGHNLAKLAP